MIIAEHMFDSRKTKHDEAIPFDPRQTDRVSLLSLESNPQLNERLDAETTDQIDLSTMATEVRRAEMKGKKPCLVVIGGHEVGRVLQLDNRPMVMGRSPDCDVVFQDEGISRCHIEVFSIESNQIMVRDLGSTNGTYVKGERITAAALDEGDKLLVGRRVVLKFAFQDVIEETFQQELYESSNRDALTGIYNRKYLIQKMIADLSFARRHHIPFSLLIFDIDHFKLVNDTYGHQSGDEVLKAVTHAVAQTIRTEDIVARYGGEEFAVIAQGTNAEGATVLGERIRHQIAEQRVLAEDGSGTQIGVTASVGVITVHPDGVADSATVISQADKNLYRAKRNGRNQIVASELT